MSRLTRAICVSEEKNFGGGVTKISPNSHNEVSMF